MGRQSFLVSASLLESLAFPPPRRSFHSARVLALALSFQLLASLFAVRAAGASDGNAAWPESTDGRTPSSSSSESILSTDKASSASSPTAWSDAVRLNHLQLVGVHNSYHVQPEKALLNIALRLSESFKGWEYTHRPLPELLAAGVRSFELDVFYDPKGGHYSKRDAMRLVNKPVDSGAPALLRPGYKVLHIQDADFRTTCVTLVACLRHLYTWSARNPGHLPITVKIEPKDEALADMAGPAAGAILYNAAVPLSITAASLADLEKEVLSVIPRWKIVKPDDVRGRHKTLMAGLKARGWPSLKQAAGKFLFMMVNERAIDVYRKGAPSLEKKLFFTGTSAIGRADAAIVSLEGVPSAATVASQHALGGMVWARADSDTMEARINDPRRKHAVLSSGVQIVHTDFPHMERPNMFGTPYFVSLPNRLKARCNPTTAPTWCRNHMLSEPVR